MRLEIHFSNFYKNNKVYRASSNNQDVYDKSISYRSAHNQIEVSTNQFKPFPYKLGNILIKSKNGDLYIIKEYPNLIVKIHRKKNDINKKIQIAAIYKQLSDAKIGPLVPEKFAFDAPLGESPALYIVMKRYKQSLYDFIKNVHPSQIPKIEERISFILDKMFDMGLLHIDAKPDNFLVDENNEIVITDFDGRFILTLSGTEMENLLSEESVMLDGEKVDVNAHKETILDVIKIQIGSDPRIDSKLKLFKALKERVTELLNLRDVEVETDINDKDLELILPSAQEVDKFNTFQKVLNHRDIAKNLQHYRVVLKEKGGLYSILNK